MLDLFRTNGSSPPPSPGARLPLHGVSYDRARRRWRVRVRLGAKHPRTVLHIGRFASALEAAVAHDLATLYFNAAGVRTNGAAAAHPDVAARVLPCVVDRIIAIEEPALAVGGADDGPDLIVEDHGSVCILRGETPAGRGWIEAHVSDDGYQPFGSGARLVEPRYVEAIATGAVDDGLTVRAVGGRQ